MEILELQIRHFGKFQDHQMKMHPGVNIIYGGNETGKSTIHAFIRAMLFGLEKGRGRRDEYQLRQPWDNPAYFAGSMRVKYRGKIYRIDRNFYRHDRSMHLVCETDGLELTGEQQELETLLGGMSEAVFCNTVFVPQAHPETDGGLAGALQKFMVNMEESGDGDLDVQAALDHLKNRKKELEKQKYQKQELLNEKLARKQMERDYVGQELERLSRRKNAGPSETDSRRSRNNGDPVTQGSGEKLYRNETVYQETGSGHAYGSSAVMWKIIGFLLLVCGVLSESYGVILKHMPGRAIWMIAGILFLSAGAGVFLCAIRKKKCRKPSIKSSRDTDLITEEEHGSGQQIPQTAAQHSLEGTSEEELTGHRQSWQLEEIRRQLQKKESMMADIDQETEQLYRQREALSDYDREIEALELAAERIRQLSSRMYREAGSSLSEMASAILEQITEGHYIKLALDDQMQVRVSTPSHLLTLEQVSTGTMNQIYFALRMAAGDLLSYGEPLPLILDEPFVMYDNDRLEEVMRWLHGCGRQVILFSCQTRERRILERIRQGTVKNG